MRVQESQSGVNLAMTKKKHKLRKQSKDNDLFPSDSSDEAAGATCGPRCTHLSKAVNFSTMKKALKQQTIIGECVSCSRDQNQSNSIKPAEAGDSEVAVDLDQIDTTVWVCLQCGHQGCDRNSREQHSLKHYETPRSTPHCIVVNAQTWAVWCYDCDNEVGLSSSRKLEECVEFIRKQMGLGRADSQSRGKGGSESAIEPVAVPIDPANVQNKVKVVQNTATSLGLPKVKGLSNLGNTCFFNAVMQNLSQTHTLELALNEYGLRGYMLHLSGLDNEDDMEPFSTSSSSASGDEDDFDKEMEPLNVLLQESGALTQSLMAFLRDMHSVTKNSIISPNSLFGEICRKAPRFKDFQQQDSHELLRQLLDGIKAEEVRRSQQSILKAFKLSEKVNPKKVDDKIKNKIKVYGKQIKHTFVDRVFGGYFISTVLCEECKRPSQIFEPFLDVSLPIAEEKPVRLNTLWNGKRADGGASGLSLGADRLGGRPSKHQQKKQKKQSRRDTKRKGKESPISETPATEVPEEGVAGTSKKDEGTSKGDSQTGSRDDESQSNNEDWDSKSDADVEDNIESDVSRTKSLSTLRAEADHKSSPLNERSLTHNLDDFEYIDQQPQDEIINGHDPSIEQLSGALNSLAISDGSLSSKDHSEMNGDLDGRSRSQMLLDLKIRAMSSLAPRQQPDGQGCSLMSCLNQFTSSELLTGSNKFGCQRCTRAKHGHQSVKGKKEVVYTNASKQVLIFCPPAILTLHLKRFQQVGFSLRKVNRHVEFPLMLDLAPYCSAMSQGIEPGQSQVLYSLYGVVEHSGRLTGGHYTAFVKVRPNSTHHKYFLQQLDLMGVKVSAALMKLAEGSDAQNSNATTPTSADEPPAPQPGKWYYISDSRVSESSEANVLRCQAYLLFYERIY